MSATSRACRATSLSSLPRAYLIGRPAVCCGVVLPVFPCVGVVLQSPRARHARLYIRLVTDILARILVRHARFPRGCHQYAMRILQGKLLLWNLSFTPHRPCDVIIINAKLRHSRRRLGESFVDGVCGRIF